MTKSKEWLLLNAVECWLHYCSTTTQYTDEYIRLRDEYTKAVQELNEEQEHKDAPELIQPEPKQSRKRTTNGSHSQPS
jgi:hypothetical protein